MKKALFFAFFLTSFHFVGSTSGYAHGIEVSRPDNNTICIVNQECAVSWAVQDVAEVKVQVRKSGEKEWRTVIESMPNTGIFNWTIPTTLLPGNYKILVLSTKDGEIHGVSQEFKISHAEIQI